MRKTLKGRWTLSAMLLLALPLWASPAFAATLQGSPIVVKEGGASIYDDYDLHVFTDDRLWIDADTTNFSGNVNLQGGQALTLKAGSQIFDNGDMRITTDDRLHIDAANTLFHGNADFDGTASLLFRGGTSSITDALNMAIVTDDTLDITAPVAVNISNDLNVTGNLTVSGTFALPAGSITATQLASNAVTAAKIATGAVTTTKIADDAITADKIADGVLSEISVADESITSAKITNGTIANTDVSTTAAIALSKLASGTSAQMIVANGSGVPTYVAVTGDVTITNAGVTAIGNDKVTDAMVSNTITASNYLPLAGGTMTGGLNMGTQNITNAGTVTATGFSGPLTGNVTGNASTATSATSATTATTATNLSGGTATGLTGLGIRSTGSGAFDMTIANTEDLSAGRTLTVKLNDVARTVDLGGNLTLANAFSTSGNFALTLTTTAGTNVTLPTTGTLATLAGAEVLTNKTLTAPDINGGTADALTSLGVRSTGSGAFDMTIANTEDLSAGRTLTVKLNDVARTVDLGGNLTLANAFSTSGNFALTLTTTAGTNVTLPTTGTLATLAGAEVLTNKTLTSPTINGGTAIDMTGLQAAAVARTATADGTGTGQIAAGTAYVTVTAGGDADSIITLPAPVVGNVIRLYVGATGYELRTSAPETIAINGGTGVAAESAIGADTLTTCTCTSATTWVCMNQAAVGTVSATEVAIP